jgi:hypothetical protein
MASDSTVSNQPAEAALPPGPSRIPSGHSQSTSPAAHPMSGFNSPRTAPDQYSPLSASPRSSGYSNQGFFEAFPSAVAKDARAQSDASSHYAVPAYGHAQLQPPSTASSSAYAPPYAAPIDLPSRRSMRESNRLPPLLHDDTTLSSNDSVLNGYASTFPSAPLPTLEVSKNMIMLPAPVSSAGVTPIQLGRPSPPIMPPQQHTDYRNSAPLAALLRAGELARVADGEEMD